MRMKAIPSIFTLLLVLLAGCSQPQATGAPQISVQTAVALTVEAMRPQPQATKKIAPTPTPKPTLGLAATATAALAQPTSADPQCVPAHPGGILSTGSFPDYPQAIQDFLNAGGSPQELQNVLYSQHVANQPRAVASADMTGDGKLDVVVSIYNPTSTLNPPDGVLMIYNCQADHYKLAYLQASDEGWGAPGIRYLQDLNADGKAELLESEATCGASSCFESVEVLAWNGSGFENRFDGKSNDLPYPDIQLKDNGQGINEIDIVGGGYGSVGAGPQRSLTRVWSYQPDTGHWVVAREELGLSDFRIHVLNDADTASRAGNYDDAIALYLRVISDPSLKDWQDPVQEQANLAAYARFKLVVDYTIQHRADQADNMLKEMEKDYPPASPQSAYFQMAQVFAKAAQSGDWNAGCTAAHNFASSHKEQVLSPLGQATFGYGNPDYQAVDICP